MKTVALFGGSFNPPHTGHFDTAAYIHSLFRPDEVWMMFSINRLKDASAYESTAHRMAMGEMLARHYPHVPLVMSDIEEKIGVNETCTVLSELRKNFPDHRFVWIMGADNLIHFHQWVNSDEIIRNFPIMIIDRPPYTAQALQSVTAQTYGHLRVPDISGFDGKSPGWIFVPNAGAKVISSSDLLRQLRDPATDMKRDFSGPFHDVVDYIRTHNLYGVGGTPVPYAGPSRPGAPGL